MLRLWNRLVTMDDNRLTKKVFIHDRNVGTNNWSREVKYILDEIGLSHHFQSLSVVGLTNARECINNYFATKWSSDLQTVPKLRTYRSYKTVFGCENYVLLNLDKNEHSVLCQLRFGILPLRIETGRYVGEPPNARLCRLCESNSIENEVHFLFECERYNVLRQNTLGAILNNDTFPGLTIDQKISCLMQNHTRKIAKYTVKAYLCRRSIMYT